MKSCQLDHVTWLKTIQCRDDNEQIPIKFGYSEKATKNGPSSTYKLKLPST